MPPLPHASLQALLRDHARLASRRAQGHLRRACFDQAFLKQCRWEGAVYDRLTLWPMGFEASRHGAVGGDEGGPPLTRRPD